MASAHFFGRLERANPSHKSDSMHSYCDTDYYAVLEVPPDADLPAIKKAYRAKSILSHPDRHPGENHEKWHRAMQQINEAFAILSNPEKRRRHDEARVHRDDRVYQQQAEADVAQAREQAQQYPQDFREFESWLDPLTRDFTKAEYGSWGQIPVARNSISGALFVIGGLVIGFIWTMQLNQEGSPYGNIGTVLLGGVVGMGLHKLIAMMLQPAGTSKNASSAPSTGQRIDPGANRAFSPEPRFAITDCPLCKRPLRYALKTTIQKLRCPRCKFVMEAHPATKSEAQVAQDTVATERRNQDPGIGWAAVAGIVAFIMLYSVCRTTTGDDVFSEQSTDVNWTAVLLGTGACAVVAYHIGKKSKPTS